MPTGLRHYQQTRDLHFLTFSCYHRLPYLGAAAARDLFECALERIRMRYEFVVKGYAVMPEHVHLLVSEPREAPLSSAIKAIEALRGSAKSRAAFLAGALPRLQRVERGEGDREAEVYSPESGEARIGGQAGGMEVVEFSALCYGDCWAGRGRIPLACIQERKSVTRIVQIPGGSRLRVVVSRVPEAGPGAPRFGGEIEISDPGHPVLARRLKSRFLAIRPVEGRGIPGTRSGTRGTRIWWEIEISDPGHPDLGGGLIFRFRGTCRAWRLAGTTGLEPGATLIAA